jgi:hypothetical protein
MLMDQELIDAVVACRKRLSDDIDTLERVHVAIFGGPPAAKACDGRTIPVLVSTLAAAWSLACAVARPHHGMSKAIAKDVSDLLGEALKAAFSDEPNPPAAAPQFTARTSFMAGWRLEPFAPDGTYVVASSLASRLEDGIYTVNNGMPSRHAPGDTAGGPVQQASNSGKAATT